MMSRNEEETFRTVLISFLLLSVLLAPTTANFLSKAETNPAFTDNTAFKEDIVNQRKEENADVDTSSQAYSSVVKGSNRFAFDLYKVLTNRSDNIFFSPWSIYIALAMSYEGAGGKTASEMQAVLHLPENDTVRRNGVKNIRSMMNESENVKCETANGFWGQEGYPFAEEYWMFLKAYYGAEINYLDFMDNPEEAVQKINEWVAAHTNGKINKLVDSSNIDELTRLVLTNAIYFKANWLVQFDESETKMEEFQVDASKSVQVPMMRKTALFGYRETSHMKMLELPYEGENFSMLILLPREGYSLNDIGEDITADLGLISGPLLGINVTVHMPTFTFKTPIYRLAEILGGMGMPTAFSKSANFSKITGGPNDLFIDEVAHKAFIKVDEEGTEAAAATGVAIPAGDIGTTSFVANHPFLFLIRDRRNGNILFLGSFVDPAGDGILLLPLASGPFGVLPTLSSSIFYGFLGGIVICAFIIGIYIKKKHKKKAETRK